ncbi:MAG TPA: alpha/beta fold hydrolase [Planctomycetota bacterium]|nr:alpha/beta fold hydrolase [Planctomycetota bacterium]
MSDEISRRTAYLKQLQRILPPLPAFDEFLAESGELPPDFDAMPSFNNLTDLLAFRENLPSARITTAEQWRARREEIKATFQRWMLGTFPPPPPEVRAENVVEKEENGVRHRTLTLRFGPGMQCSLRVELFIPKSREPLPVFMSQFFHRTWISIAVRRGYIGCIYAGSDGEDDTDSYIQPYKEYDFARIPRRAWSASRVIDYLQTVPEADKKRIALTGHSRNGKQTTIAVAFDERIAIAIPSSPGSGGTNAFRCYSEEYHGESAECLTRAFPEWFHQRLRFFTGRAEKMPFDLHELLALIAPRPCLLGSSYNDPFESVFAIERTVEAARPVYELLNAGDKLRVHWRWGGHETSPELIETYIDWCEHHFRVAPFDYPKERVRAQAPKQTAAPSISPQAPLAERVSSLLGEAPPQAPEGGKTRKPQYEHTTALLARGWTDKGTERDTAVFGEYVFGGIYAPEGAEAAGKKLPAVIWLHGWSFQVGYAGVVNRRNVTQVYHAIAQNGFVTLAYDQIGFGGRILEAQKFYEKYPRWSLFGKMLRDLHAAVTFVRELPYVDPNRVFVAGFSLGAMLGLHGAALDSRIAGLVCVSPPQPFSKDTEVRTGGLRRWSRDLPLIPALESFIGKESSVPYDVPELLSEIAPRPAVLIRPQVDRYSRREDICAAIEAARRAYAGKDAASKLELIEADSFSHIGPENQAPLIERLRAIAGL